MPQSEFGKILLFDDFCGPEIPVATAIAYGAASGGMHSIGPFRVTGDLVEVDTGIVGLSKAGGWIRIGGNNEDGKGAAVGTEVVFSPSLNGPLVLEARVELRIITTTSVFIGFVGVNADDVAEPVTSTGTTMTLVAAALAGFIFDSQLTALEWHMPYNGGTATAPTASNDVDSDVLPVAAESVVLRVEIDPNGTVRWYIDGVLKQTVVNAVSTTTLLAGLVGAWGTTTTATDIDCDYLAIKANRDWTV
jgi:hypothetical protein